MLHLVPYSVRCYQGFGGGIGRVPPGLTEGGSHQGTRSDTLDLFCCFSFSSTAAFSTLGVYRRLEPPSGRRVLTPVKPLYAPASAVNIHSSALQGVRASTPNTPPQDRKRPQSRIPMRPAARSGFPRTPLLGSSVNRGNLPSTSVGKHL